jgi:hypothetical protein
MPNHRMMPPAIVAGGAVTSQQNITVNGRNYSGSPGSVADIPDMDAQVLGANGWVKVASSGTTAQRPTATSAPVNAAPGTQYWDVTLSKLVVFDGKNWRDPATGNAV